MSFSQNLSGDNYGQTTKNSQVLIEVSEPQNHGVGNKKYTDYLVKTKVDTFLKMLNFFFNIIFLFIDQKRQHYRFSNQKSFQCVEDLVILSILNKKSKKN